VTVLLLPEPPSANRWWRQAKGKIYTPPEVLAFKQRVMVACRNAHITMIPRAVPVFVTMTWYRKRQAGDLDKRIGITLDALQGHWYENDSQVAGLLVYREESKTNPRLEVEVRPIAQEAAA
jgi:Holliday junction resolvase RusA-like endonuclease